MCSISVPDRRGPRRTSGTYTHKGIINEDKYKYTRHSVIQTCLPLTMTVVVADDRDDEMLTSHVYRYVPAEVTFVVRTLVLVALPGLSVVILVLLSDVRVVPVPEAPLRQMKDFVPVTLVGTDAVHTMLKVL